jgi:hypothetical protein
MAVLRKTRIPITHHLAEAANLLAFYRKINAKLGNVQIGAISLETKKVVGEKATAQLGADLDAVPA